jgi:predicted transcriptional regulator
MVAIVSAVIVLGLGIFAYLLWWSIPTRKQAKETVEKVSLKKKALTILHPYFFDETPLTKMELMEKLNIENSRLYFMLLKELEHRELITIDKENIELTEFGCKFYENFVKQSDELITF